MTSITSTSSTSVTATRPGTKLCASANAWRQALPTDAYLARYGGEEFAVLLPDLTGENTHDALDRVHLATPTPLTVSIGSAEHRNPGRILDAVADAALYTAKASGRDLVIDAGYPTSVNRLDPA